MYKKVDVREESKRLWAMSMDETPEVKAAKARLQLAAEPTPEGNAAWANIVYTMQEPIRSGLLDEDSISNIYQVMPHNKGEEIEYPIDWYQSTDRDKFWAYTLPDHGYLPQRYASSGSVKVRTYRIGSAIDFWLEYIENARWDVLQRGLDVYRNGFVKKMNSDGWNTLMAAAFFRNIVVRDDKAKPEQITPRLFSLMQTFMKRNAGGNMTSSGFVLTDIFISPEAAASIRNWDLSLVSEGVRERIFSAGAGTPITGLFGMTINEHEDLGEGQPLQQLFLNPVADKGFGGALQAGSKELIIGMDMRNTGTFAKMPVRRPGIQTFADDSSYTHRSQTRGYYGWVSSGVFVADSGFILLGQF